MLDTKYSQPHIPEICLSTLSVNHTINDFGGNQTLPKTTHNTSTFNTGETSSNYAVNLSLSPHKFSRLADNRFIQDPGCKSLFEKDTYGPRLIHTIFY